MFLLITIYVIFASSGFTDSGSCSNFLNDDARKNPNIYILGELHEQDLQKYFVAGACSGSISLGIEAPSGGFKSKVLERYTYNCVFEENIFGFEDELAYSMLLLFREYIMLDNFSFKEPENFRKSQIEVLTLLWLSDLMSELWEEERDNIYESLASEDVKVLVEKLFDKFMELKQNRKFKRKVSTNGDFIKSWNSLLKSGKLTDTLNLDELLNNGPGFISVIKALALSLYERKNANDIPCYSSYINDMGDQALGLFCYLELMALRDKYIYINILERYCDLAKSSSTWGSKKPMVITIGAGHLPEIVSWLRKDLGEKTNMEVYAYKKAIAYAADATENVRNSAKTLDSGLFSQNFYEIMDQSISFFSNPDLRIIDEGKDPSSILLSGF